VLRTRQPSKTPDPKARKSSKAAEPKPAVVGDKRPLSAGNENAEDGVKL